MWPFNKAVKEVTVTNETYARWLRACRPPWIWFHERSDLEQEALALLGEDHVVGLSELGHEEQAATDEPTQAKQVAQGVIDSILALRKKEKPSPIKSESMAGFGERQSVGEKVQEPKPMSLFGKSPEE